MRILDTAAAALHRYANRLARSAAAVSTPETARSGALVDHAVTRIAATASIQAQVSVVRADQERTDALLDIIA